MRSDLGRLGAIAKILQVGSVLTRVKVKAPGKRRTDRACLAVTAWAVIYGPAKGARRASHENSERHGRSGIVERDGSRADATPNINLIPEFQSKTPEEKEQEAVREKAYKESLKKIPDAKTSSDPWGTVRSADAPKTAAPAKPKTKTGSNVPQPVSDPRSAVSETRNRCSAARYIHGGRHMVWSCDMALASARSCEPNGVAPNAQRELEDGYLRETFTLPREKAREGRATSSIATPRRPI